MNNIIDISDIKIGEFIIDTLNENKEVEIVNMTQNSIEVSLLRDTRFFDKEVTCFNCNKVTRLAKDSRNVCGQCGGKAFVSKKLYTGFDALQWYRFENKDEFSFCKRFKKK